MANMAAALLILFLAAPAVYAVEYTVGDSTGWTSGYDYTNWLSGKTFTVGDVLVFNYGGNHKVDEVSKSDYDNCVSANALKTHNDGNTKINLTEPGTKYFLCPTAGHCLGGMKLAVTVTAAPSTTPGSSPAPSGSETPSSGTPPATTSPPPPSSAASIFCNVVYNMMVVFISLVVLAIMG